MVIASEIKWASYRQFEGAFYPGGAAGKYVLPASPTEADEIIAVTAACEGGNYMAVNMYDKGILSSGLIQWIEGLGQYSVSAMLGELSILDRSYLRPIDDVCASIGCTFKDTSTDSKPRWRFVFKDARGVVDTPDEQYKLFYLRATGVKGTWDTSSTLHAKSWAAAVATVWEKAAAQRVQNEYTAMRLMWFCTDYAARVIKSAPNQAIGRAFRAAYLSFAVNNPKWASDALRAATMEQGGLSPWTRDWLIHVLKYLTFHANISIYPHRYKGIRPVLEKLYGVNLPDFADELKKWQAETGQTRFLEPKEAQEALIKLGYDLGPWGADGKWGSKSAEALLTFEQQQGIPNADGKLDPVTTTKLAAELDRRGLA